MLCYGSKRILCGSLRLLCGSLRLKFIQQKLDISINIVSLLYIIFPMKKITIIIAFLLPLILHSQPWQLSKQIGGTGMDNAQIFHIDSQHNVYIKGDYARNIAPPWYGLNCVFENDTLYGNNSSFIAKYSENGTLSWVHNFAPNSSSIIYSITYDSISESFFIAGMYHNSVNLQGCGLTGSSQTFFLYKMDLNGNCIWSKNIGGCAEMFALTCDQYGNLYMSGTISAGCTLIDTCHADPGTFIAKFNPEGWCQWVKTITPPSNSYFSFARLIFQNNDLYALGYINGGGTTLIIDTIVRQIPADNYPLGIICLDSMAHAKWLVLDSYPYGDFEYDACGVNNQGDFYIFRPTEDTTYLGNDTLISQGKSSLIMKYNKEGNLLGYNHLLCGSTYIGQNGRGLCVQNDGTYYITGSFSGTASFGNYTITADAAPDMFLAHFTDSGDCLGVDHVGGGHGTSVAADETGVYITGVFSPKPSNTGSMTIGGNTFHTRGFEDIVFAKHDLMTGTEEIKQATDYSLVIYANPNKGSFRVKIPVDFSNEKQLELSIFDMKGKLIGKQSLSVSDENPGINIYGQPSGTYSIRLSNGSKSYGGKMIVE